MAYYFEHLLLARFMTAYSKKNFLAWKTFSIIIIKFQQKKFKQRMMLSEKISGFEDSLIDTYNSIFLTCFSRCRAQYWSTE